MAADIFWPGQSGKKYGYWIIDLTAGIQAVPGNYMFAKKLANGNFVPIYIGQADNLATRLANHERLTDAKLAGATHVMAHTTPAGEQARLAEECDLILRWQPSLNIQNKKVS